MFYSHLRFKLLLCLFLLTPIACGIQAIPAVVNNTTPAETKIVNPILNDIPNTCTQMRVTALKSVYVRSEPNEKSNDRGVKKNGDVVCVDIAQAVGDSMWCHYSEGWSNCKYLEVMNGE